MSGQAEIRGTLHIQEGKKGRSFQVSYTNLKGKTISRMSVQAHALFFDREKAREGDEVLLALNATGQIEKCTIPGKEALPETRPAGAMPSGGGSQARQPSRDSFSSGVRGCGRGSIGQGGAPGRNRPLQDATAPYNFIPYDPAAVLPEDEKARGTWSGVLICRLTALTPLLVAGERRKRPDKSSECRFFQANGNNIIPGSSIKGVLRSLVEILSFSAMRQVSRKELFWRIVTGAEYREAFGEEILGGYLCRRGADYTLFPVRVERVPHGSGPLMGGERVETGGIRYKDPSGNLRQSCDYRFSPPAGKAVPVDREVVAIFERQMTEDQKKRWKKERCAGSGHPVFYREEAGRVVELGLCRYFRRQYAASPNALAQGTVLTDLATRLFGRVDADGTIKGRVTVEPALVEGREYRKDGCCAILATPHPTSLAHYIVQDPSRMRTISRGTKNHPEDLAGYRSGERLRGWKMYWHHDVDESLWFAEGKMPPSKKVLSWLYPLAAGAGADVRIHIDRLTDGELGAVLEALSLASGDHALKLGMGKPLGFGSVRLELVRADVGDIRTRYTSLVERMRKSGPGLDAATCSRLRARFRQDRLERLHGLGMWKTAGDYAALPPIQALRQMTDFTHRPAANRVRYMSLEEFRKKALLAGPEDVLKHR